MPAHNEKHLDILRSGVDKWNEWRRKTDVQPVLQGANLQNLDLTEINFCEAVLNEADLSGANLQGANLHRAQLQEASLAGTQLHNADLSRVSLKGARAELVNLTGADASLSFFYQANLRRAGLLSTNFSYSILDETDLTNAKLGSTIFFQTHLRNVRGLEKIDHGGPSNLDHITITRTDPLPLSFLRGCGLPDLIIDNVDALRGDAIRFYSCFISYSSENEEFAQRLYADLQNEGVRCWFAPHNLKGGKKLHRQINEAIRMHDKLVLILSEDSMESDWVEHEIRQARKRERRERPRVLFPIRLVSYEALQDWTLFDADSGRDLAQEIREYYIPDFSQWKAHIEYAEAFSNLVTSLRKE